jgi:hypothetical protein
MFAYAEQDYEDVRYTKETWLEQKPSELFPLKF